MSDETKILLQVLIATVLIWGLLTLLAVVARGGSDSFTAGDLDQAFTWGTDLLGLAATLGGFLGLTAAARAGTGLFSSVSAAVAEGGAIGILAGATLLEVGGTAVPVALAAFVVAAGGARFVSALRDAARGG